MNLTARTRLATCVTIALGCLVAAGATEAHYRVDPHRWFFQGQTFNKKTDGNAVDPVTIIFYTGGPASLDSVGDHLKDDWSSNPFKKMSEHGIDDLGCEAGHQYMRWNNYYDPNKANTGYQNVVADKNDRSYSDAFNGTGCYSQYHIRLWDAHEHAEFTLGGRENEWAVGSIHHETRNPFKHHVDMAFDTAASKLRTHLNEHCSRQKWRILPGSAGKRQSSKHTDGYLTIISMQHTPGHGGPASCPGETHVTE
jgi:hypothetical protein